jgi:hypothetical protein
VAKSLTRDEIIALRAEAKIKEIEAEEKTCVLVCTECYTPIYELKRKRLEQSVKAKKLEQSDLKHLVTEPRIKGSIQIDCPWCFGLVFEPNYGGGFLCMLEEYVQDKTDKMTKPRRFPGGRGVRSGVRIGSYHMADPHGTCSQARSDLLHGVGSLVTR